MRLVIETDIGRDPDDFFALCYLMSAGVEIVGVVVSPGDKDQIAVTKALLEECGVHCPVGSAKPDREQSSASGVHLRFLEHYDKPMRVQPDGHGCDVVKSVMSSHPDAECFVCGPLQNIGKYLDSGGSLGRTTMQGGFMGYDTHGKEVVRLEKFEGKTHENTFNLGGDKKGAFSFINGDVESRSFVGKHLCHTIVYDNAVHQMVKSFAPANRPMEIFHEAMDWYLQAHPEKKFHDPTAAVCHLHPGIATWLTGRLDYQQGKWGTVLSDDGDNMVLDIDRDALWRHIATGS